MRHPILPPAPNTAIVVGMDYQFNQDGRGVRRRRASLRTTVSIGLIETIKNESGLRTMGLFQNRLLVHDEV